VKSALHMFSRLKAWFKSVISWSDRRKSIEVG
jgi:hypothetical protein